MSTQAAFQILELPVGSSRGRIKKAYRDLARVWHPDRFEHDHRLRLLATRKLQEISRAYRLLIQAREGAAGTGAANRRDRRASPRSEPASPPSRSGAARPKASPPPRASSSPAGSRETSTARAAEEDWGDKVAEAVMAVVIWAVILGALAALDHAGS